LKPTEQCIQAAKKAQSVLGMIKQQFKIIDKEDFRTIYITYVSNTAFRHGHHSCKRIKYVWKKYKERQLEWSKVSRNFCTKPD